MFRGIRKLPPGHAAHVGRWPNQRDAVLGVRFAPAPIGHREPELVREGSRTFPAIGQAAADERRAARRVSERRTGFERDRGSHEPSGRRPTEDVLGRLRVAVRTTSFDSRAKSPDWSAPITMKSSSRPTPSSMRCRDWSGTKTSRSGERPASPSTSSPSSQRATSKSC